MQKEEKESLISRVPAAFLASHASKSGLHIYDEERCFDFAILSYGHRITNTRHLSIAVQGIILRPEFHTLDRIWVQGRRINVQLINPVIADCRDSYPPLVAAGPRQMSEAKRLVCRTLWRLRCMSKSSLQHTYLADTVSRLL